jgi:hypothetical protein
MGGNVTSYFDEIFDEIGALPVDGSVYEPYRELEIRLIDSVLLATCNPSFPQAFVPSVQQIVRQGAILYTPPGVDGYDAADLTDQKRALYRLAGAFHNLFHEIARWACEHLDMGGADSPLTWTRRPVEDAWYRCWPEVEPSGL